MRRSSRLIRVMTPRLFLGWESALVSWLRASGKLSRMQNYANRQSTDRSRRSRALLDEAATLAHPLWHDKDHARFEWLQVSFAGAQDPQGIGIDQGGRPA